MNNNTNHQFEQPLIATSTSESSTSSSSSTANSETSLLKQTAYLLQTSNGNAILIQPSLNHTQHQPPAHFILDSQTLRTLNYGFQSIHLDQRPESNVYQTIENDLNKNTSSTLKSATTVSYTLANTNDRYHKLHYNASIAKQNSTLKSSILQNNRRHDTKRDFYCVDKKLKFFNYSWKCIAFSFFLIILLLFGLSLYLSILRAYNLSWNFRHLSPKILSTQVPSIKLNANQRLKAIPTLFTKLGDCIDDVILANEFFKLQFYMHSSQRVRFNLTIDKNYNFGLYGALNQAPTLTRFNFFEPISGVSNDRVRRQSTFTLVNHNFVHLLDEGLWFVYLYNDNQENLRFKLKTESYVTNCPFDCHNHGECLNNKCVCFNGYTGRDCALSEVNTKCTHNYCSNNGLFQNGKCKCDIGWTGLDCSLPCDCHLNGECILGICICHPGFKGEFCDELECKDSKCTGNGVCQNGTCLCFNGFSGESCEIKTKSSLVELCSGNGDFNHENKSCSCRMGWVGADCSLKSENFLNKCAAICLVNGSCKNGICVCNDGFYGQKCNYYKCPNNCSFNGDCVEVNTRNKKYQCVCNQGWSGQMCETQIEMICNDNIDNDNDGLFDCDDSECCLSEQCRFSPSCATSPEPKDRLLRKQPPSNQASFFDKVRFLIEDASVQVFASLNEFNEAQVCVVRGQVVAKSGQPLIGVKVSVPTHAAYGFTFSRNNGIFDLMLNGGGSIQLEFTRNGFQSKLVTISAAWNQFVHIDDVFMYLINDDEGYHTTQDELCQVPLEHTLKPKVQTTWKEIRLNKNENEMLQPDTGILKNEYLLDDSPSLKLVYMSNQANGFHSFIYILLTHDYIPEELDRVYLEIQIEGVRHRQEFIAETNLFYEYAWDRRNAYEQRVYGYSQARVSIGYKYDTCSSIIWYYFTTKIAGFDLPVSEIGSWSVNINHRLNYQQGILHKGDGTIIYLKEFQLNVDKIPLNGLPNALSIRKDGLIFIGDSNGIFKINGLQQLVAKIENEDQSRFHLVNDPINGDLYLSHQVAHNIFKVELSNDKPNLRNNTQSVLNNECDEYLDHDSNEVNDETCYSNARINNPRDLTIDKRGQIYVIDGNLIKLVDKNGTVKILVGQQQDESDYRQLYCRHIYSLDKFQLFWPRALAINPLDNTLYILDESAIFKLTPHNTLMLITGIPHDCLGNKSGFTRLFSPIDIEFNSDGDLFILENDKKSIKRVVTLKENGLVSTYFNGLSDPITLAIHPNKSVYVLDRKEHCLYHIRNTLKRDEYGRYNVLSPQTNEIFIFNRFGIHMSTVDSMSGEMVFNFTYSGNSMFGKLLTINDNQNKRLLTIKRDSHGRADSIQTQSGELLKLKLNNLDMIRSVLTQDQFKNYNFTYLANTGLLIEKNDFNGNRIKIEYDKNGRAREIDHSNGQITKIDYNMNLMGIITHLKRLDGYEETWTTNSTNTCIFKNGVLHSMIEISKINNQNDAKETPSAFNTKTLNVIH